MLASSTIKPPSKKRKAALSVALEKQPQNPIDWDPENLPIGAWTAGHEKEAEFQDLKKRKRQMEALWAGSLLEEEVSLQLLVDASAEQKKMDISRRKRRRQEAQVKERIFAGEVPRCCDFAGMTIYVQDADRTPGMDEQMRRCNWSFTDDAAAACDVFLHNMVGMGSLPSVVVWAAALQGAWVLLPEWASKDAEHYEGPCIKFVPAVTTKRWFWISPAFSGERPDVAECLRQAASRRGSKWTMIDDVEAWALRKQAAQEKQNSAAVIALVTDEETTQFQDVPHVFGASGFFSFACKVDSSRSRLALAGQ